MSTRKTILSIVIGGALVVALLAGSAAFIFPTIASAQSGAATPAAPADGSGNGQRGFGPEMRGFGGPDGGPGGHGLGANMDKYLADALGITVEELQAAQLKAEKAALADAVKNGQLTQDQADQIAARQALRPYTNPETLMAKALGMSVEELQAARQAGKTMQDLAAEKGLTAAQVQTAMQEAFKAAVAQAVTDGVITQAQADQILSQGFGSGFGPGFGPGGPGGRGGHGKHGGFDGGFPGDQQGAPQTAPQTQPTQTAPSGNGF